MARAAMNEQTLKAFLVFLFVFSVLTLSSASFAAMTLSPVVPGYSAASGGYRAAAGSFTMAAANSGFIQPAVANVGGKAITVPATLRMAANAGQFAKNAIRISPLGLIGGLALGYMADQGMFWDTATDQWAKANPIEYIGNCVTPLTTNYCPIGVNQSVQCTYQSTYQTLTVAFSGSGVAPGYDGVYGSCSGLGYGTVGGWAPRLQFKVDSAQVPAGLPLTDDDWDALPDPLPVIAPELPYAPYMPEGVPVDAPDYDFAPYQTPIGDPYTKPDGSTVQPMASVSPNGDSITVDTYDQPLTDSNGDPVPNPTPQDTPEPAPEPDICQKNPDSLMCAALGTPPAAETVPTTALPVDATVTPIGGVGTCPASVSLPHGITWSYQPICDFASAIRPFIIGFAWLSFSYIVVGAIKQ